MPPKVKYGREEILNGALSIVNREGLDKLSVRRIARELSCSTTPVYSTFRSMPELENSLISRVIDILISYTEKDYTENLFLNIGIGIVFFARQYRKLYRVLFLESDKFKEVLERFHNSTDQQMKKAQISQLIDEEERKDILRKMWIFTHGLATLISTGYIENESDEFIIDLLGRTGGDVISSTIYQKDPELFKKLVSEGKKK
ncbi:MAG: TetR/AcrR family transcriptional regulator [Candidatus Aminicenantes bacterium]|nr:TetR/AcrR family transcriptional regulator [Candidatus Aminicenantes bacterium]MCK5004822.1 TetR/AcrR family transcriptional regulator [Candidatus Aminicenantes bacterium]